MINTVQGLASGVLSFGKGVGLSFSPRLLPSFSLVLLALFPLVLLVYSITVIITADKVRLCIK